MFKRIWKNYKFPFILLISIIIGSIIGIIFGEDAMNLKPFGTIFINMLYMIVVPLVFFTISSSISSIKSLKKLGKIFGVMFIVFIITNMNMKHFQKNLIKKLKLIYIAKYMDISVKQLITMLTVWDVQNVLK